MIRWNTDVNAPGCPGEIVNDDGRTVLIQIDWNFPGVASTFGWNKADCQVMQRGYYGLAPCEHRGTDGTVNCPDCGYPAAAFIREARQWLEDNDGAEAEDPGYF